MKTCWNLKSREWINRDKRLEVIEELKRFTVQEMTMGFSFFEEALLVFQAEDPNIDCT